MGINIRVALATDIDNIMAVEMSWPDLSRAPVEKFKSRLEKFPQGFWVAEQDKKIVATLTSCPIQYQSNQIDKLNNWDDVTNKGMFYSINDLSVFNALYVASGVIDCNYRGKNIFELMINHVADVAQQMNFKYVVAGAVIPGYAKYCQRHGHTEAHEYVFMKRGRHLVDPLLASYQRIGFSVPDVHHVKADYYPDAASHNYAALVVKPLP